MELQVVIAVRLPSAMTLATATLTNPAKAMENSGMKQRRGMPTSKPLLQR